MRMNDYLIELGSQFGTGSSGIKNKMLYLLVKSKLVSVMYTENFTKV